MNALSGSEQISRTSTFVVQFEVLEAFLCSYRVFFLLFSTFLGLIRFEKDMSRCVHLKGLLDRAMDRYVHIFPCLSDPARRSSLGLKVALVFLHILYVGILFLFDEDLIEKTKTQPWYTVLYLLLFFATLIQYFITSCSSPGYVLDAMRTVNENGLASKQKSASSNKDDLLQVGTNLRGSSAGSWTKMVLDLYPPGTSIRTLTCFYCNVEQPPRVKHCHDCDRCVLQFDHHCVWLGTCIGHGNHCRFWWYIFEETALCLWTVILYISYLKAHITTKAWWKAAIMIVLLVSLTLSFIFLVLLLLFHCYLVLTNQTTYELVRRRRIPYLREFPERVYPFSRGICRNLYSFCCGQGSLEALPSADEVEQKMKPYTCLDVVTCRCC